MVRSNKKWCRGVLYLIAILLVNPSILVPQANAAPGIEDGGIKQHEMFEFEAFIKHDDIIDGTAPFDSNDQAGNDSNPNNKIVRSFDSVSYPVKVTINPKKVDKLENIKLRLTGTLTNGIVGNRVNAKFAVGGYEDLAKKEVGFTQEYTIKQTGNSIMIPISIEVQGAKPGLKLTPKIRVEVVSVDGADITGAATDFNTLPGVTVSAQVNIKPYISSGLTGQGIQVYPYAGITGDDKDVENTHAFSVAWGVDKLSNKTDMRGATFPDPEGKINYKIELSGNVAWDAAPKMTGVEAFDFTGRDAPFMLFDHQPINTITAKIGRENMLADGISYNYAYRDKYAAPQSKLPDLSQKTIDAQGYRMVWDSGSWEVSRPTVSKNTVTYTGSNTGYVIGSTFPQYRSDGYTGRSLYGVDDKLFASHSFLVMLPNQYRIGGPNNQNNWANNANYTAKVTLENYVDKSGAVTPFNKTGSAAFTERNNPNGSYALNTTLFSYPAGVQIGTPNIGDGSVSKGDASTLIGEDVQVVGYLYPKMVSYGGHQAIFRWNTDAFELTESYANIAKDNLFNSVYYTAAMSPVRSNPETQFVYFGVAKFTDNKFANFTSKGINDYTWYTDYKEAIKKGPVGAMRLDVRAATAGRTHSFGRIPLRVKQENIGIGAETKNGTANIMVVNYYAYPDEARKTTIDVTGNKSYHNPAIWDSIGNMVQKQSPSGSTVNFETLAVLPAETQSVIDSDKVTYYNSETIHWTVKNSVRLPPSGVPEDFDSSVQVTQTLPKGLTFKTGTGMVGNAKTEPEITRNTDGTTTLLWDLLVSSSGAVSDITFDTAINPFALSSSGVQSGITIENVISSELDQRPVNLRTSTKTVTILKVGMVGIFETLNKLYGDKNSDFKITLSPYTTIEDEKGVTGLTLIPLNNDSLGSKYTGSATLKDIQVNAVRKHNNPVKIYLNKSPIYDNKPQHIDVTKNGWYEYTGVASQLNGAVSLLFFVDGLMTNTDDIQIEMTIQTANNNFGDQYLNETVINSATDYKLSPISNRVRYTIRADLELGLERVRIYTNKATDGLPVSVRVKQTVLDAERVKNTPVKLVLYDGQGQKITEKSYTQSQILRENELLIPASVLNKGDRKNYTVKIEGYDTNLVWVKDGEGVLDTDGYTSIEKTMTNANADASGNIQYKGVVMTERELGRDIVPYYETLKINKIAQPQVKSGYGFAFEPKVEYTNDLMTEIVNKLGIKTNVDATMTLDKRLIDTTIEYYRADTDQAIVNMDRKLEEPGVTSMKVTYHLPESHLEQGTGKTYSNNQKENGAISGATVSGGHKLYVPVWIDHAGKYDAAFKSKAALGSHRLNFDLLNKVDVHAYMFNHTDSDTSALDELLIHPMLQEDIPRDWQGE